MKLTTKKSLATIMTFMFSLSAILTNGAQKVNAETKILTKEEAKDHPKKNVLMKALGANDPIDIDIFDCDMDIDEILLASDGLTNMLEEEQIEKVLLGEGDIEDKVIKLIRKANNRGGTDNISVAYLIKGEGEE